LSNIVVIQEQLLADIGYLVNNQIRNK